MKIRNFTILALILFNFSLLPAQESTEDSRVLELGLNITNTLSGFLNSGGQSAPLDPYLLSLKTIKNNRGFRLGLNYNIKNSNEIDNFAGGIQRITKEITTNLRLGFEKRIPLSARFTLYWGLDGVVRYKKDEVKFFSFNGELNLNENQVSFGGGPVLGLMFFVHPRVYLSTESYAYGVYQVGNKSELLNPNDPTPTVTKIRGLEVIPAYPNALYVTFLF